MKFLYPFKRISSLIGCLYFLLQSTDKLFAQKKSDHSINPQSSTNFRNATQSFIENIGQYGKTMKGFEQMGELKFGYEGLGMPVLFTSKGLIHLHRKVENISKEEERKFEKAGVKEAELERKKNITDRVISMKWVGANSSVQIITAEKTADYHTYGLLTEKAFGYKKIIYKNLYDGIDVVYSFINDKLGFEYSLIVQPGADVAKVKMKYDGDVKNISVNSKGNLIVQSDIDGIEETIPVSYYGNEISAEKAGEINTGFKTDGKEISFSFPQQYDKTKAFIIDPFVSSTANLTGLNVGKAIDVDYDYAGNVYVSGGGAISTSSPTASNRKAKYNSAGVLQWIFNGVLTIPSWTAGYYMGGWVVDKASGAVYMGQGYALQGFRVIRISTTGLYDNYISTPNANFQEAWKMYWFCNSGSPQIICAGGGTTGNNNIAICAPPSVTLLAAANLTGSAAAYQDMSDLVIDPVTNSLYSIYASGLDKSIENRIFKNNQPYTAASIAWSTQSGYLVLGEIRNRPYINVGYNDNSSNILAQNATYLFYWDGQHLKAFNKLTGAAVGTALTIGANTVLMQGGIVADACDNVFVGSTGGIIKVYKFNGALFDDAAAVDINVPGYTTNVYDLALDESKKLLYASGNGFVASLDVAAYCPTSIYTLNIVPNCAMASATASVSPLPPAGSTITYALYIGTTLIATNTTGIFLNLLTNTTYTIIATINFACSGIQTTANFILPGPTITATPTHTTCGNSIGQINISATGTVGPYTFSLDGITYVTTNPFINLPAGLYTVFVKDANGCIAKTNVTILNTDGPTFTFTQTNATCGNNIGSVTVTASGGTTPYQYSINNGITYQANNFFTGLAPGTFILKVRDALGCMNAATIIISSGASPLLTAIPSSATCGNNNGTITAFGTGGTAPLEYSINGNIFQPGGTFNNLTPGTYTVTVRDAIGCFISVNVTIANNAAPTVTAVSTPAACGNVNGSITATGSNGVAPLTYSINGTVFQSAGLFTGLAAGTYTVSVKDFFGCIATTNIIVSTSNGPTVSATSTAASCGSSNGSITISATGTPVLTYSINNVTFQASNIFTNLPAGNYFVFVRDGSGCMGATSVVVSAVASPAITAVSTPSACTSNTGTITATASGGAAPLEFSLDGTNYFPSSLFTNLATGNYTVYVRDALGCIKTTTIVIANASGLGLSLSAVNSSCNNNGVITATAIGGVAPLQYNINGGAYQASNIFTGLAPGNYTINVRDANNCIVTKQALIISVNALTVSASVPMQTSCASANAVIIATGSGGIAPLTYSINGTIFQTSGTFINVAAGNYTVTVKDATGCIATQVVTINTSTGGPGISTFTVRVRPVYACNDPLGGRIDQFRVNGANCLLCTYSINYGAYLTAADPIWAALAAGTYAITARDVNGCTKTIFATIEQAVLSTATYTVTPAACNTNNGSITLTGVGLNTPYHASITGLTGPFVDFDPTHTFTGLSAGTYTIILADDEDFNAANDPGNCLVYLTVIVPSIGGPAINTTQISPSCNSNNGSITVTGSGSVAPYTFSINGGAFQAAATFNNLTAGTYILRVQDGTGCVNLTSVTLTGNPLPTLTAIAVPTTCGLNNGSITATAGNTGNAPFEYSINGTVFQTSNVFLNLSAGTYTVFIKDANGCFTSAIIAVTINAVPTVTAFTIAASCNNNDGSIFATGTLGTAPYQFSLDGIVYQSSNVFNGLAAGFYTVYLKDDRNCVVTTGITVGNLSAPTFTTLNVDASCGNANGSISITAAGGTAPYSYSINGGTTFQASGVFTSLLAGTYIVVVKDNIGCIVSRVILLRNILGPQILTATVVNAACGLANGSITATGSGGVGVHQYSKDGITYQPTGVFNLLLAGSFTIYIRDANSCVKTLPVTVLNLPGPTLVASSSSATCGVNDGTITAIATGGTVPLSYSKDGIIFQASNVFTGLAAGPYTITVRDARGCLATFPITVASLGAAVTPTFNAIGPVCIGATLSALPTSSTNIPAITGTWSPALNNTTTTIYTFTPTPGQCATSTTLTITINPKPAPIIISHN